MNTLRFLKNLQIPERNDREWFRSHEPAYRQAEKVSAKGLTVSSVILTPVGMEGICGEGTASLL